MMRLALRMVASAPAIVLHGVCYYADVCVVFGYNIICLIILLIVEAVSKIVKENAAASCYVPNLDLSSTEPYISILSLVSHENKFSDVQQKTMFEKVQVVEITYILQQSFLLKMADTLMDCYGEVIKKYLHAHSSSHLNQDSSSTHDSTGLGLRAMFLHHLLQLRCNSHNVAAVEETEEDDSREGEDVVQSTHEIQLGSAIYPTASLFNHSCWPNIIFRYKCMYNLTVLLTLPHTDIDL